MRKQKVNLNKFERMLLESKFPTLRILLEKDEALDSLFGGGDEGGGDDKSKEEDKGDKGDKGEESGDGGGLDDLFGGEDEGGDKGEEESNEEGVDAEGEKTGGENEEQGVAEDSNAEKESKKQKEKEAIEKAAKTSVTIYKNIVGDVIEPANDEFDRALFGSRSAEIRESSIKKQKNRIQENISKYLFKNINMKQLSRKKNLSLGNFYINEHQLLKVNKVINEATSVDEIINNKFWEENATVDLVVDNAINLTRHFEDLIDIPKLIMNSVAIKFGKQATQESGENKNAENEYKLKLDEFLQKYATALKQLPDYENYDTSRTVFNTSRPDIPATGAFSPGG